MSPHKTVWELRFEGLWTAWAKLGISAQKRAEILASVVASLDEAHRFGSAREASSAFEAAGRVARAGGARWPAA